MTAPRDLLNTAVGRSVIVVLKDRRSLKGTLSGFDEFINITLEGAEETTPEKVHKLGRVVVRGSQVIAVHLPKGAGAGA